MQLAITLLTFLTSSRVTGIGACTLHKGILRQSLHGTFSSRSQCRHLIERCGAAASAVPYTVLFLAPKTIPKYGSHCRQEVAKHSLLWSRDTSQLLCRAPRKGV